MGMLGRGDGGGRVVVLLDLITWVRVGVWVKGEGEGGGEW